VEISIKEWAQCVNTKVLLLAVIVDFSVKKTPLRLHLGNMHFYC